MVALGAIMNIITTVLTFVEGMINQVAPIVNTILDKRTTLPPRPAIHPNCQQPNCGSPPHYCPDAQLSPECFRKQIAFDNGAVRRVTTVPNDKDDDDEKKDKSSTSISPSSMIMVIFIGVIALAIIGFLFIRCSHQNDHTRTDNDRKSSTWSV